MPLDLTALPVDLMSFASHKINGPKGVGALYLNSKVKIAPALHGGTQEANGAQVRRISRALSDSPKRSRSLKRRGRPSERLCLS